MQIYVQIHNIFKNHNMIMYIHITYIWRLVTSETQSLGQGVPVRSARKTHNILIYIYIYIYTYV